MSDTNTIMGWVLGAGIVALGSGIFFGEIFHAEAPETPGYAIEGIASGEDDGGKPAVPLATLLAAGDEAKGEAVFKKCVSCHTIAVGGANGVGPNLFGIMGRQHAGVSGFDYSSALKDIKESWTFENMDAWIASPRKYANGTKMAFAGISDAQQRADLLVYMNGLGSNLTLPDAPVQEAVPAEGEEPKLTEEQVAEDQATDAAAEAEAAE